MSVPSVTIGNATKKSDYDRLVSFVAKGDIIDGSGGDVTLTTADFGRSVHVNSSSARTIYLPSVDSSHIGAWIRIVKLGSGSVTIDAADSDTIANGAAGGTLINDSAETCASIILILGSATGWIINGGFGTWRTSVSTFYHGLRTDQRPSFSGVITYSDIIALKIAKPANPASGYVSLYPKSDDALYLLTSGGTERALAFAGEGLPVFGFGRRWLGYRVSGTTTMNYGCSPTISSAISTSGYADGEFSQQSVSIGVGQANSIIVNGAANGADIQRRWLFDFSAIMMTPSSKNDAKFWIGLSDANITAASDDPASRHLAIFRWSYTIGGGANWYAVTKDGTTISATDTGVAFSIDTTYRLRIVADASNIYFYINGNLVATHSANLPGSTTTLFPISSIVNNSASTGWSIRHGAVSVSWKG